MRPTGHARVNPNDPRAFATCDRCGFWYNHYDLHWSFEWSGPQLINQYLLVCNPCDDVPQEQLRTIVLPPDPPSILNARPESFLADGAATPTFDVTNWTWDDADMTWDQTTT